MAQALRPTSGAGDMGVDPDDVLPENFHLEPLAQKRFGARWTRISRLVSVDPVPAPAGKKGAGAPPSAPGQ